MKRNGKQKTENGKLFKLRVENYFGKKKKIDFREVVVQYAKNRAPQHTYNNKKAK